MTKNNYATRGDVEAVKKAVKKVESRILESEIKILGELKDMREEFSTHQFSHIRINDELQEHSERLKKLETAKI